MIDFSNKRAIFLVKIKIARLILLSHHFFLRHKLHIVLHFLQDHSYYIYYKYSPWSYENPNPFHRLFWKVDEGKFFFASAATIVIPAFVATLLFCFYHMVERYTHLFIFSLMMSGLQIEPISGNSSFSPDCDF